MSKLIKKLVKGVKKVFRAVKKVVKKVFKSKLFKAVALAAAVFFGAPVVAGLFKGGSALTSVTSIGANAASALGQGHVAGTIANVGAAAANKGIVSAIGSWATANPLIASAALTTGGQLVGGMAQARSAQKAYDRHEREMEDNARTQLPISERLSKYTQGNSPQVRQRVAALGQPRGSQSYYDPATDSYRNA